MEVLNIMKIRIKVLNVGKPYKTKTGKELTPVYLDINNNGYYTRKNTHSSIPVDTQFVECELYEYQGKIDIKNLTKVDK